ncbi:hypothetical protein BTVI_90422 [Pitangus sulphuratus]|nr:hypothetical protein BTVI_90422 [Pitangus sulphuratus]
MAPTKDPTAITDTSHFNLDGSKEPSNTHYRSVILKLIILSTSACPKQQSEEQSQKLSASAWQEETQFTGDEVSALQKTESRNRTGILTYEKTCVRLVFTPCLEK